MKQWFRKLNGWSVLAGITWTIAIAIFVLAQCGCGDDRPFKPGVYDMTMIVIQSDWPATNPGREFETKCTITEDDGAWSLRWREEDWFMEGKEEAGGVTFVHHQDMGDGNCDSGDEYNDLDMVLSPGSGEREVEGIAHSLLQLCGWPTIEEDHNVSGRRRK